MTTNHYNTAGLYSSENEHDSCGIGFVASIKGEKSQDIVSRGLQVLNNMTHRGAESSDNVTGDGAGILVQIPHDFYLSVIPELPPAGSYGTGIMFLPKNDSDREACETIFFSLIEKEKLRMIANRELPVRTTCWVILPKVLNRT
jgi:glutamate synthase (NADPH) large chain